MNLELKAVLVSNAPEGIAAVFAREGFSIMSINRCDWNQHLVALTLADVVVIDEIGGVANTDDTTDIEDWLCQFSQEWQGPMIVILEQDNDQHFEKRPIRPRSSIVHHQSAPLSPLVEELKGACQGRHAKFSALR